MHKTIAVFFAPHSQQLAILDVMANRLYTNVRSKQSALRASMSGIVIGAAILEKFRQELHTLCKKTCAPSWGSMLLLIFHSPSMVAIIQSDLTPQEKARLHELERVIETELDGFLKVGAALIEIRTKKLHRATHDRWEDYCRDRWALSVSRANQLISVVQTYDTLTTAFPEDVPMLAETNESALRPLSRLDPELQQAAWELVKRIEERPSGVTIADTVGTIRAAIEAGWKAREEPPSKNEPPGVGLRPREARMEIGVGTGALTLGMDVVPRASRG